MSTITPTLSGFVRESNAHIFAHFPSRAEAAAQILGEIAKAADPGARLGTKQELRGRCEVAVGTFNEALKIAQNRGVVSLRPGPGGGIFSQAPSAIVRLGNLLLELDRDDRTVAEAVHVRNALDVLLMDDAVAHRTNGDIEAMRLEIAAMGQAVQGRRPTEFIKANWHLHAVIANISPNTILQNFYLGLLEIIEQHTLGVQPTRGEPLQGYIEYRLDLHRKMVDAIEAQDPIVARALVEEHNTENYQQ